MCDSVRCMPSEGAMSCHIVDVSSSCGSSRLWKGVGSCRQERGDEIEAGSHEEILNAM